MQVINAEKDNHVRLKLIEKYEPTDGKVSHHAEVVCASATRERSWRLLQPKAIIVENISKIEDKPEMISYTNGREHIKYGKVFTDVRVGDVWEVRGTTRSTTNTGIALVEITDVTPFIVKMNKVEREGGVRLYPEVERASFREGRYKLWSRKHDSVEAPPMQEVTPDLPAVIETQPDTRIEDIRALLTEVISIQNEFQTCVANAYSATVKLDDLTEKLNIILGEVNVSGD